MIGLRLIFSASRRKHQIVWRMGDRICNGISIKKTFPRSIFKSRWEREKALILLHRSHGPEVFWWWIACQAIFNHRSESLQHFMALQVLILHSSWSRLCLGRLWGSYQNNTYWHMEQADKVLRNKQLGNSVTGPCHSWHFLIMPHMLILLNVGIIQVFWWVLCMGNGRLAAWGLWKGPGSQLYRPGLMYSLTDYGRAFRRPTKRKERQVFCVLLLLLLPVATISP